MQKPWSGVGHVIKVGIEIKTLCYNMKTLNGLTKGMHRVMLGGLASETENFDNQYLGEVNFCLRNQHTLLKNYKSFLLIGN